MKMMSSDKNIPKTDGFFLYYYYSKWEDFSYFFDSLLFLSEQKKDGKKENIDKAKTFTEGKKERKQNDENDVDKTNFSTK